MKNTWKGITNILNLNNSKGTHVTQLNYNGKNLNNNKDMADAFNEFFTMGPTLDNDMPQILETLAFISPPESLTCSIIPHHIS